MLGGSAKTPVLSTSAIRDIYHGGIAETPDLEPKREAYGAILERILAEAAAADLAPFVFTPGLGAEREAQKQAAEKLGLLHHVIETPQLDPIDLGNNFGH